MLLFCLKKKKKWKICIDYRAFNILTLKNDYLLSRIQNCWNIIETTRNFNKIDLINNYWQINIIEINRYKITFNTRRENYVCERVDHVSKYNEQYIASFFKQIRDRIFERHIDLFSKRRKISRAYQTRDWNFL